MDIDAQDVINRYVQENATLYQRAILAEARADSAETKVRELEEQINSGS